MRVALSLLVLASCNDPPNVHGDAGLSAGSWVVRNQDGDEFTVTVVRPHAVESAPQGTIASIRIATHPVVGDFSCPFRITDELDGSVLVVDDGGCTNTQTSTRASMSGLVSLVNGQHLLRLSIDPGDSPSMVFSLSE